jgi:DNA primase
MTMSTDTPRANLTLSESDLAACRPIVGEGGHVLRALCPFHGSDRQRSLRVQVHSGRFVCFACGAWGYMDTARTQWREEQQRQAAFARPAARRQRASHHRQPPQRLSKPPAAAARTRSVDPPAPRAPAPGRPDLAQQLTAFQAALPGSPGAAYLQQRGIPLALAQQVGVGYAAPGTWPHAARDWRGGRVVFPHTTPDGHVVNLYGRAVGTAAQVPKAKRHDHLPGAKGYFNAAALQAGREPLWVCEGAFDALALLAAGVSRVVAIFGVQGWRWDWAREVRELGFALDADAAGQQQWRQLARQAALRGKRVAVLPAAAYGGCKDVNEAWVAGTLAVHTWCTPAAEPGARRDYARGWAPRA